MTDSKTPDGRADAVNWRISSFSGDFSCVAVADHQGRVAVRNSNRPDAGTLHLDRDQFSALVAGIKAGEFDDLA